MKQQLIPITGCQGNSWILTGGYFAPWLMQSAS